MESLNVADLSLTTCMVVEDQPVVLSLLSAVLKIITVGRVLPVRTAAEAVDLIKRVKSSPSSVGVSNIDFALIDWNLEGDAFRKLSESEFYDELDYDKKQNFVEKPLQGVELARWIRRNESTAFMPILAVSAYSNARLLENIRAAGMNSFVSKPFNINDIARHVQRIVQDVRPYITTSSGYFGPDRRRTNRSVDHDRRVSQKGVKTISPPRTLRNKTMGTANVSAADVIGISHRINDIAPQDFLEYVRKSTDTIQGFMRSVDFEAQDKKKNQLLFNEIDFTCNDVLGHVGCFSYQMIAEVISGVSRFIGDRYFLPTPEAYALIEQQMVTVRYLVDKKVKGPTTDKMRPLFATTVEVMNKVLRRNRKIILELHD